MIIQNLKLVLFCNKKKFCYQAKLFEEPLEGIEPSTSSLPRKCSTTEPQRQIFQNQPSTFPIQAGYSTISLMLTRPQRQKKSQKSKS
jgi:hypothetical protein